MAESKAIKCKHLIKIIVWEMSLFANQVLCIPVLSYLLVAIKKTEPGMCIGMGNYSRILPVGYHNNCH